MQSKLFQFLLVLFFAGSIVLIGTKELHHRFVKNRTGTGDAKVLIQQLRGEMDLRTANATKAQLESQEAEAPGSTGSEESSVESMMKKLIP